MTSLKNALENALHTAHQSDAVQAIMDATLTPYADAIKEIPIGDDYIDTVTDTVLAGCHAAYEAVKAAGYVPEHFGIVRPLRKCYVCGNHTVDVVTLKQASTGEFVDTPYCGCLHD